ncbi:MAG TPA: hypothetical protein VGG31_02265 [Candidatus Dormibacteraeota bacterium]|jgi:hypothetical protein
MLVVSGPRAVRLVEEVARLGQHAETLGQRQAPDHSVLLLDARAVLEGADQAHLRQAMQRSRRHHALIALDLGPVDWIRAAGGSRAAYHLAAVQPDILFATEEAAAELAAPLEGIAPCAVLIGREACVVHGRHLAVPSGADLDVDAFEAAFCVALVEGVAPVEAVAQAVLVAAGSPAR